MKRPLLLLQLRTVYRHLTSPLQEMRATTQLRTVLWKNYLLKKRRYYSTIVEVVVPLVCLFHNSCASAHHVLRC